MSIKSCSISRHSTPYPALLLLSLLLLLLLPASHAASIKKTDAAAIGVVTDIASQNILRSMSLLSEQHIVILLTAFAAYVIFDRLSKSYKSYSLADGRIDRAEKVTSDLLAFLTLAPLFVIVRILFAIINETMLFTEAPFIELATVVLIGLLLVFSVMHNVKRRRALLAVVVV